MNFKITEYDTANYLDSNEMISGFLLEELKSNEPQYIAAALHAVIRARGGVAKLSEETGLTVEELELAATATDHVEREIIRRVAEAFDRKIAIKAQVA